MSSVVTVTERIDFLRRAFGRIGHDRDYTNVSMACPFCPPSRSKDKQKLIIHTGRWVYHCWRCGARGRSLVPLLRIVGAHSLVEEYQTRFGGAMVRPIDALLIASDESLRLPMGFQLVAVQSQMTPLKMSATMYLHDRGLSHRDMWYFKLGVATDPAHENRVIMPSFDAAGRLNYVTSRRMDGRSYMKYLNCAVSRNDIVFNELNVDWSRELVLVEGPFDLMKCPDNAVALLGCQLNEETAVFDRLLLNMTPVVIALDRDMRRKAWRYAKKLSSYGLRVRIADMRQAADPGSMTRDELAQVLDGAPLWDRDASTRVSIEEFRP